MCGDQRSGGASAVSTRFGGMLESVGTPILCWPRHVRHTKPSKIARETVSEPAAGDCGRTLPSAYTHECGATIKMRVRQANWRRGKGESPLERRMSRSTIHREPCSGTREGAARWRQREAAPAAREPQAQDHAGAQARHVVQRQTAGRIDRVSTIDMEAVVSVRDQAHAGHRQGRAATVPGRWTAQVRLLHRGDQLEAQRRGGAEASRRAAATRRT